MLETSGCTNRRYTSLWDTVLIRAKSPLITYANIKLCRVITNFLHMLMPSRKLAGQRICVETFAQQVSLERSLIRLVSPT